MPDLDRVGLRALGGEVVLAVNRLVDRVDLVGKCLALELLAFRALARHSPRNYD